MPTAKRLFIPGHHYHLTHRCHNRSFLLKFAKDRDAYRAMLRRTSKRYGVPLLGYCITSNHVHLLVTANSPDGISRFMDTLEGDFAQYYNRRKGRSGAFWGRRYHATAVDESTYLWNCLVYIELNMVRAGVVAHPAEWRWCSFSELVTPPKRYRLIDTIHFERVVGQAPGSDPFRRNYETALRDRVGGRDLVWTESLAVGEKAYVDQIAAKIENRRMLETAEYAEQKSSGWVLREQADGVYS